MKKEKGVTLVALVVTIIVLIILAGISINLVLGDNGIITIAKKAKENTELAKIEEETELNELYTQLENNGGSFGETTYDVIAKLTELKTAIAKAIDEAGGIKPDSSAETAVFANNIKGIVKEVTKSATATSEDIEEGKTAWVNGEEIIGTKKIEEMTGECKLQSGSNDNLRASSYFDINVQGYKKIVITYINSNDVNGASLWNGNTQLSAKIKVSDEFDITNLNKIRFKSGDCSWQGFSYITIKYKLVS